MLFSHYSPSIIGGENYTPPLVKSAIPPGEKCKPPIPLGGEKSTYGGEKCNLMGKPGHGWFPAPARTP
jgi:hypothetical protein